MAAVTSSPIPLYPVGARGAQPVGSVKVVAIGPEWGADGGLRVQVEHQPSKMPFAGRVVLVDFQLSSAMPTRRPYGRLTRANGSAAALFESPDDAWWVWHLTLDEIEQIERDRVPNVGSEVTTFRLTARAMASGANETLVVEGETSVQLASSDWISLIHALGYGAPPSLQALAGDALTADSSWNSAQNHLAKARKYLALGEDHEAMTLAYRAVEAITRNPYRTASWSGVIDAADMPPEKVEVIRGLLSAQANVLSKLGRHPGGDVVAGAERTMLPVDHWEAELAVASTQLLLAASIRWRTIHERKGPRKD
jgi:hypothetical protein